MTIEREHKTFLQEEVGSWRFHAATFSILWTSLLEIRPNKTKLTFGTTWDCFLTGNLDQQKVLNKFVKVWIQWSFPHRQSNFFFLLFATIFAGPCWPIDRMRVSATSAFLKLEDSSIFLDSQQGRVVPAHLRHVAVTWGRPKVAAKFPKWKASVLPSFSSAAAHSVCYCSPAPWLQAQVRCFVLLE